MARRAPIFRKIVEEGDGSFNYVTLAVFRGGGRPRPEYAVPSRAADRANTAPAPGAGVR